MDSKPPSILQESEEKSLEEFHKKENSSSATINRLLSLLAVTLGALAIVIALLIALDARIQIDELKSQIQLKKVLNFAWIYRFIQKAKRDFQIQG